MKYKYDYLLGNVKACLFDLDGTLVDSMWVWNQIDVEYLGSLGYTIPADLHDAIEGMSFSETARYFKDRFKISDDVETIGKRWNDMAYDKYVNDIMLKPGALDFIKKLKANNIKTAICTSNSQTLARACLKARGVEEYFDEVITSCEVGAGKPAPDIYLCAAGRLSVPVSECLVFEDVLMGIKAGINAGMRVVAVADKFTENVREEKEDLADYFIDNYLDIED